MSKFFKEQGKDKKQKESQLREQLDKLNSQKSNIQSHFMEEKISVEEYRELKMNLDDKLFQVQSQLEDIGNEIDPVNEYLTQYVPLLQDLLEFYKKSDGQTKKRILSCIFNEKIYFEENRDAAISYSTPINVLLNASKVLGGLKKEKEVKNDLLSTLAPPSGLEPETL